MGKPDFIVFSDDWGRHPSSCQHLFRRIARKHRVLWVNTIGLRGPKADRFTLLRGLEKIREWTRPLHQVSDTLWVLAPIMLPVSGEGWLSRLNRRLTVAAIRRAMRRLGIERPILWASVPTASDYVGALGESAVVYYVTDDYGRWPGGNVAKIHEADRQLTARSDLILACSDPLMATHRNETAETLLLPHAVDFEHFAKAGGLDPDDLAGIPHPRACFFGLIYEKIDLDALVHLAVRMPDLHLVMIGPVKTNVDRLEALPNVRLLGPRPYQDLPAYLHAMDVIVVPYVLDEETLRKGPLKIRECLAVGKPTVARAIPDLRAFADVIHLFEDRADFVEAVRRALSRGGDDLAARMQMRAAKDTWEARAATVMDHLGRLARRTPKAKAAACAVTVSNGPPLWQDYLDRHTEATIFHDSRWGDVMKRSYGNMPYYLTARRGDGIAGVLQLVYQKSVLFGSHLCSLPYFDAAGVLADDAEAAGALLSEARSLIRQLGVKWVEIRQTGPLALSLPSRTDKVTLNLPLPSDPEALWEQFKPKVRNQVRKAQHEGLTVHQGGSALVDEFHAVYARNMRDLGSPPHSRRFFRLIAERFASAARLFVVRQEDRPVAASLTLTDRHGVHVPWAASDWRFRSSNANMLLYWHMLKSACESGSPCFDFGRSTRDSGTHRFKRQWGAEEAPVYWQYLLQPGQSVPELRPDSRKYCLMVACWQHLPVLVARMIGPRIIARLS